MIVNAFSVPVGKHLAYRHIDLAAQLIQLFAKPIPTRVFILGGGSLKQRTAYGRSLQKMPALEAGLILPNLNYRLNLRTVTMSTG